MPSRVYYFSKQSIDRDGKQKKAIPNSQWKGPGAYYLRGNKGDRYWAKRSVAKDIARSSPIKAQKYGTGAYSQYHDIGTGKQSVRGIGSKKRNKAVEAKIKRKGYPTTAVKDASQAKISRATRQRTRAEKRRLAKSRRATAKKKATTKRKTVKRSTVKRKATTKRKTVKRKATTKRKTKRSRR